MNKEEISKLLGRYEWNDLEFKKGQRGVPAETYKTVCAFANTGGGRIVFGIKDEAGRLDIVGVLDVDSVQNDFLGVLRSGTKFNHVITAEEDLIDYEGKTILVFYIPESPRHKKPVFMNGNWNECYIRSGGCDQRCTEDEIKRFIRNSSDVSYDSEPVSDVDPYSFFDEESLRFYRNMYNLKNPGRTSDQNNIDFLIGFGFLVERDGKFLPTRAAVLIFGKEMYVQRVLNNQMVVDYQRIDLNYDKWFPEVRWHDRVVIEGNLISAWRELADRYNRLAEKPFSLDPVTFLRNDEPKDFISFREALINLLIHQDYGDFRRKAVVKIYRDRTIFWNPGDSYADEKELLETTEKEVRNPTIVSAFRRIGMSEQAGSGVTSIFNNWRELGNVPPVINNYKDKSAFELILLKDKLLSDDQTLLLKETGINLSENEARVFAYACRNFRITLTDVRAVTGKMWHECRGVTDSLIKLGLIDKVADSLFEPAQKLVDSGTVGRIKAALCEAERAASEKDEGEKVIKSGTEANIPDKLTDTEYNILVACETPRSIKGLLEISGLKNRDYFRKNIIVPMIDNGLIRMVDPDKPRSSNQKYVITKEGLNYLVANN